MKRGIVSALLGAYLLSTIFFTGNLGMKSDEWQSKDKLEMTPAELGIMCISREYPGAEILLADSRDNQAELNENSAESPSGESNENNNDGTEETGETKVVISEKPKNQEVVFGKDPVVLIVHTHATESYLPATQGNYHTTSRNNTVREVGGILAQTLKENGIPCVQDETLHDNPSYNMSYSRSLKTTKALLKKYPSVKCVIDLHRDATTSDETAEAIDIGGVKYAPYSFVVSNVVDTYSDNIRFVNSYNNVANRDYGGFSGEILLRGYEYNQHLSSKYMLLEVGYNRNNIEESKNTAKLIGKILSQTLKEGN